MPALILAALLALPGAPSLAQESAPVTILWNGKEAPEDLARLVNVLAASGRSVVIRREGDVPAAAASAPPLQAPAVASTAVASPWSMLVDSFMAGLRRGNDGIARLPTLAADWSRAWSQRGTAAPGWGAVLATLVAALAAAAAARVAYWWSVERCRAVPVVAAGAVARYCDRMTRALFRLGGDIAAIVAFAAAAWAAAEAILPDGDLAHAVARNAARALIIFAAYLAAGRFLLAPGEAWSRLLPLPRADRHFRILAAYGALGPLILASLRIAALVASEKAAIAGLFALTAGAITLFKVWWFWDGRHDFAALVLKGAGDPAAPSRLRRAVAGGLGWFLAATAVAIWAIGRIAAVAPDGERWGSAAGLTQILVVALPILAAGAAVLVRDLLAAAPGTAPARPLAAALAAVAEQVAAGAVWIAGLWLLAALWSFFLDGILTAEQVRALAGALAVGAVALAGWIAWAFLGALFDAYAPRRASSMPGDEDDAAAAVQTRLGTVMPLLRATVTATVVGLTVLLVLSRLGIDIAPLLAGFGILGLAISFGSQALVRDIVSGIFFIADDAFRVGEYIDTGRLKGTVERITLRSVQLRHQNGQMHTVPFGQIASVTNASRDWATVKFNIRLERDSDIEKARKVIKKVGQAMQADAELGGELILPLKLQGIAEIADSAIVCRLKFTAKPARSSWVQREALKRVHAALQEAGVAFASNAVTVRGATAGDAPAGAAAATRPEGAPAVA